MSTADYSEMKAALKEALVELFHERRELFRDLFEEVIAESDLGNDLVSATASRPETLADDDFEEVVACEIQAFHRLHPTLLEQHPGEFVAIHNQELVDHDREKLALYQRIQQRYPDQFVLMRRVEQEPEPELRLRSTRYFINS